MTQQKRCNPIQLADLIMQSDAEIEAVLGGRLDGIWRKDLRQHIRKTSLRLGPLSLKAGFLLTPWDWHCPICFRGKLDIMRSTDKGTLTCRIVHHHDHALDKPGAIKFPWPFQRRFSTIAVCEDCNLLDSRAKKIVKAPKWFSFSPEEIRYFAEVVEGGKSEIDEHRVRNVWLSPKVKKHITIMKTGGYGFDHIPYFHDKVPEVVNPFRRNSPRVDGRKYVKDGYHASFEQAMADLGIQFDNTKLSFEEFCVRSGGTPHG